MGLETTISADERPHTYTLDRAASGTDFKRSSNVKYCSYCKVFTGGILNTDVSVYIIKEYFANPGKKNFGFEGFMVVLPCTWSQEFQLYTQYVPGGNVNILGSHTVGHSKQKKMYIYMCPLPNGFRDRAVSLYRSLDLAPNIVLHSRRTAPLYKACKSV
jgi:hypothetical protein